MCILDKGLLTDVLEIFGLACTVFYKHLSKYFLKGTSIQKITDISKFSRITESNRNTGPIFLHGCGIGILFNI